MPSLVGLGFHPPLGWPKTLSFCLFVCLSVRHAFERQSLCARFRHEGVGVQKRFLCLWIGEGRSCAPVLNFLPKSKNGKKGKNYWLLATGRGHTEHIQIKFGL